MICADQPQNIKLSTGSWSDFAFNILWSSWNCTERISLVRFQFLKSLIFKYDLFHIAVMKIFIISAEQILFSYNIKRVSLNFCFKLQEHYMKGCGVSLKLPLQ